MVRRPKLGLPLQTLRNAPDAREGRLKRDGIQDLDPDQIDTSARLGDRLPSGIDELVASIRQHGQRVPILVRPLPEGRFGLIYGYRRMTACAELGIKVRAIVSDLDDMQALQDQILENQHRRDLSFIERGIVAKNLLESDQLPPELRSSRGVAEVLGMTEAGISQLLGVVRALKPALISAIGPAPGIGRPRWEDLKRGLQAGSFDMVALTTLALDARDTLEDEDAGSDAAFMAVLNAIQSAPVPETDTAQSPKPRAPANADPGIDLPGIGAARIKTNAKGGRFKLEVTAQDPGFVDWLQSQMPEVITELHERWKRSED